MQPPLTLGRQTKVTRLAYSQIVAYGMSQKVGQLSYKMPSDGEPQFDKPYSEQTAELIDDEARRVVREAYTRTKALLVDKRAEVELVAQELLGKEILSREDMARLLGKRPFAEKHSYEDFVAGTGGDKEDTELPPGACRVCAMCHVRMHAVHSLAGPDPPRLAQASASSMTSSARRRRALTRTVPSRQPRLLRNGKSTGRRFESFTVYSNKFRVFSYPLFFGCHLATVPPRCRFIAAPAIKVSNGSVVRPSDRRWRAASTAHLWARASQVCAPARRAARSRPATAAAALAPA